MREELGRSTQDLARGTFDIDPQADRPFGLAAEQAVERDTLDGQVLVLGIGVLPAKQGVVTGDLAQVLAVLARPQVEGHRSGGVGDGEVA